MQPCDRCAAREGCFSGEVLAGVVISVVEAVERDLAELETREAGLSMSALAATALALARELDSKTSATSKSMCAKALVDVLAELRGLAPEKHVASPLDEINARRARKLKKTA